MIKNQRQYQITKSQLAEFNRALADAEAAPITTTKNDDAAFRELEIRALRSQVETLMEELDEYESLLSGVRKVIEVTSFEDLPKALIQARIASGLSQKDLADRLGLKEQQVQRYEATLYESASLTRIGEVVNALGLKIRKEILLPSATVSLATVWDRLKSIGLVRDFILERLLPRSLAAQAQQATDADEGPVALTIASVLGRIFGFTPANLFADQPLALGALPIQMARFKLPAKVKERFVGAYTVYAHYLALLVLSTASTKRTRPLPDSWEDVRYTLVSAYGGIGLQSALQYVWDLGIAVLPLNDSGTFHGATWRVDGRNVIVLKQQTDSIARWLIDLLHELFHALEKPEEKEFAVIEESETSEIRRTSKEEIQATEFAGDVLLDGRAEELAELCAYLAGGSIPRLKTTVPEVAAQAGVSVGALANYLAFRLSTQDENWWGTAQNLQEKGDNPLRVARDFLLQRIKVEQLNPIDRELLSRALVDSEEAHAK